jgi:hypothetical protein
MLFRPPLLIGKMVYFEGVIFGSSTVWVFRRLRPGMDPVAAVVRSGEILRRLLRNSASHGGVAMELAWWLGEADVAEAADSGSSSARLSTARTARRLGGRDRRGW